MDKNYVANKRAPRVTDHLAPGLITAWTWLSGQVYPWIKDRARGIWLSRKGGQEEWRNHPEYQEAIEFRKSFSPKDGVDYGWVKEYSKTQLRSAEQCFWLPG